MRIIDADALGVGRCNPDVMLDRAYAAGWNGIINIINDAPTIDPIRAAGGCRCGECKHGRKSADALEFDGITPLCECNYMTSPHRWYEYCSWGELREAQDDG